jgi:hypothetical protein
MDNLGAGICASSSRQKKGAGYRWVIRVNRSGFSPPQGVAGFTGIGGSFRMEWVAALPWNQWQVWSGIRTKSPVVMLLEDIAVQKARPDGWVPLSIAGQIIKQHAPDEISALHEKFGSKTMKALVLATEMFELCEESTDGGGIRVLYRLKT